MLKAVFLLRKNVMHTLPIQIVVVDIIAWIGHKVQGLMAVLGNGFGVIHVIATKGNIVMIVVALIVVRANIKIKIVTLQLVVKTVQKANIQARARHLVVGVQMVSMQTERATAVVHCAVQVGFCNGILSQKRIIA